MRRIISKKIKECMTSEHLVTAKEGITLEEAKRILAKARVEKLPIVDDDFNLKGLITIKDIEKQIKYPNCPQRTTRDACSAALQSVSLQMFLRPCRKHW